MPLAPPGSLDDALDARAQAHGAELEPVRGERVRGRELLQPQVGRIPAQCRRDLVELHLLREPRLRGTVPPLGATGWLVGEGAARPEPVARHVVRDGLQLAGIQRRGRPVAAVTPAVQQRFQVHRHDRAVLFDPGLEPHQHRMPPAVRVEDLFARQRDLDRAPGEQRGLRRDDLVVEGVGLAAEAAAVGRRYHADAVRRHCKRAGHLAVQVVRRLGGGPQRQPAVGIERRGGRVLLQRQVRVPLVEEHVLEHAVGSGERRLDISKGKVRQPVDVRPFAVVVDAGLGRLQRLLRGGDRGEGPVGHADQGERVRGLALARRDHCGDRIADVADLVPAQGVLVLAHRHDAVGDGEVRAREHQVDARRRAGRRRVDLRDQRVRMGRPQQLAVQHARQRDIVGEARLARHLGASVHPAAGLADDLHAPASVRPCPRVPVPAAFAPPCPCAPLPAASSTASKIWR